MSRHELLELWAHHLDGAALTAAEAGQLCAGLERDELLRAEVLADGAIDGLLRAGVLERESGARFTSGVATLIAAAGDEGRFAAQVRARLGRSGRWRSGRPRRRWSRLATAAAAAAVLLVVVLASLPAPLAVALPQPPLADLPRLDAAPTPLASGHVLHTTAPAVLSWRDGTRAEVAPGTTLTIADPRHGKQLDLATGTLRIDARPQLAGRPLRIATPQAQAVVVGTAFTLRADAATSRLEVEHGLVRLVSPRHGERAVGAGQAAIADAFALRAPGQPVFAVDGTPGAPLPGLGRTAAAPDGRACLQAVRDQAATPVVAVTFTATQGWCAYDARSVVTCRYWLGANVRWAGFYVQDFAHHHHGQWHLPLDQRGVWREVRFTLAELEAITGPAPMPGDVLHVIMLQAQFAPDAELFVDRLTITPPDAPAP